MNPERSAAFAFILRDLAQENYALVRRRGWYGDGTSICELLVGLHSEVSEAFEAYRVGYREDIPNEQTARRWFDGPPSASEKPEGFAAELADVFIRTLNLAEHLGIDLGEVVLRKLRYDATRPHRHGGKVA